MEWPLIIAIAALVVSLGSLATSGYAAKISRRSLSHSKDVHTKSEKKEWGELRRDILAEVSDSHAILNTTRIELGAKKADFEAEPQAVRDSMIDIASPLFGEYLPKIETSLAQLDAVRKTINDWSPDTDYQQMLDVQAKFYDAQKSDELVSQIANVLLANYLEALAKAKKVHNRRKAEIF